MSEERQEEVRRQVEIDNLYGILRRITAAVPSSFFESLPLEERVERMVEAWRRGIQVVDRLEDELDACKDDDDLDMHYYDSDLDEDYDDLDWDA